MASIKNNTNGIIYHRQSSLIPSHYLTQIPNKKKSILNHQQLSDHSLNNKKYKVIYILILIS